MIGEIKPLREVLKKLSCLGLMEFLSENKSLSKADIEYFLTFIQTVPYRGNISEFYIWDKNKHM